MPTEAGYVQSPDSRYGRGNEERRMVRSEVGREEIYTLTYADVVVLIAEEEEEMRCMIERLRRYLDEKGLELNAEKSKVMRFRKEGGREKKVEWRWKEKVIEDVKRYNYLGYTLQRNGGQEAHIRERVKKGAAVMEQVWGIGKRKFKGDSG